MTRPRIKFSAAVLGSADPRALAMFYERLLCWTRAVDEPARPGHPPEDAWVVLRPPEGGTALSFQHEPHYQRPVWPTTTPDEPQMMVHLDIGVDDLDAAVAWASALGATMAAHQPQDGVRVMLDPAGHPFCLFPAQF